MPPFCTYTRLSEPLLSFAGSHLKALESVRFILYATYLAVARYIGRKCNTVRSQEPNRDPIPLTSRSLLM